jgi:ankyrin repeat protein
MRIVNPWLIVTLLFTAPLSADSADAQLATAVQQMDRATIRTLLQAPGDVNASQVDGTTALLWAAYHDDLQLVEQLLRAGADVRAANRYGVTAL